MDPAGGKQTYTADTAAAISPRDKRYLAQVEKALATFYTFEEWADYVTFLSRLTKALAFPEKPRSLLWIPLQEQVLDKLALCLSPTRPSGVHQKALQVYASLFDALTLRELNCTVAVWLPGLLLVLSYGSTQVKPQLLSLYEHKLLEPLESATLRMITRPLMLLLLAGLDDENSEIFADCLRLMKRLKDKLGHNAHFWKELFLCIISSPEKRIGALHVCLAYLPVLTTIQLGNERVYSAEAQACLVGKGGLLVRAFAAALDTQTSFNPATDIVVIRAFFDLLLARLPLNLPVLTELVAERDKQLLLMACVRTTLRREMSLNRRLWAWFLGPSSSYDTLDAAARKQYFCDHAVMHVSDGLLTMLESGAARDITAALRMALALIIDKWEISQPVTSAVFCPVLQTCRRAVAAKNTLANDILHETSLFFNQVEAVYIWRYVTCDLLTSDRANDHEMLFFVLKTFELPDSPTAHHIHLAILVHLQRSTIDDAFLETLEALVGLARPELLVPAGASPVDLTAAELIPAVQQYYRELATDEGAVFAIDDARLTHALLERLKALYAASCTSPSHAARLSAVLCEFVYSVPRLEKQTYAGDQRLIGAVLCPASTAHAAQKAADAPAVVFGLFRLCRYLGTIMDRAEKAQLLKVVMCGLWAVLVSLRPANYQVEAVKAVFELPSCFRETEVEAGLVAMVLAASSETRCRAFATLWTHAAEIADAHVLLTRPLFVILDGAPDASTDEYSEFGRFLAHILKDSTASRLFQIVCEPLVAFLSRQNPADVLQPDDDLALLNYHVQTLRSVVCTNRRAAKDAMSRKLDAAGRLVEYSRLLASWKVSTYKTLVLRILAGLLLLKHVPGDADTAHSFDAFVALTAAAHELVSVCTSGSDSALDALFGELVEACAFYVDQTLIDPRYEKMVALTLRAMHCALVEAKSLHVALQYAQCDAGDAPPRLVTVMLLCIAACDAPGIFDAWFRVFCASLHVLSGSILDFLLAANAAILAKMRGYFDRLRAFDRLPGGGSPEDSVLLLLAGLESTTVTAHSHIVRMAVGASPAPGDGFLGNVITGVFQIEAPGARADDDTLVARVLDAVSQVCVAAYTMWDWMDAQAGASVLHAAPHSAMNVATTVRFRARKLLECLGELERQRVIETVVGAAAGEPSAIKLLHVLDSGREQLSVLHILNAIRTRCHTAAVPERERARFYAGVTALQLAAFLSTYVDSMDHDTVDELWEALAKFTKDAVAYAAHYAAVLVDLLDLFRAVAAKTTARRLAHRDVAATYAACLGAVLSRKQDVVDAWGGEETRLYTRLAAHTACWGTVLLDPDKVSAAAHSVVSALVVPKMRSKSEPIAPHVSSLVYAVGDACPVKTWKLAVQDVFTDNSFFATGRYADDTWQRCVLLWIASDPDKSAEYVARVVPQSPSATANIFAWSDASEIHSAAGTLRLLAYLCVVRPRDSFAPQLGDLFARLAAAWQAAAGAGHAGHGAVLTMLRAATLRCSEPHLVAHWPFITQTLARAMLRFADMSARELAQLGKAPLGVLLAACKLLDQLLLLGSDEFNTCAWLFVGSGSVTDTASVAYVDRLAKKTEALMMRDTPILVERPRDGEPATPLLSGVRSIKSTALLKVFLGLLSYIHYERTYGLISGSVEACEAELLADLGLRG
ncbi:hypothetical protein METBISCDRAFT_14597 [Metschnikowia bicuspidata]|uniref:Uncharacterized protein n=1 Tax=Metschnikowia bicuspidata TaxID=27322 RepID=A0A4V1J385_9ASCO|nr:hypothetical protein METBISCDRAFT_14597 [Metschnikowia bicuspidata]